MLGSPLDVVLPNVQRSAGGSSGEESGSPGSSHSPDSLGILMIFNYLFIIEKI